MMTVKQRNGKVMWWWGGSSRLPGLTMREYRTSRVAGTRLKIK